MKRFAFGFLIVHAFALCLGLFGLLSAVPDPGQFAGNPAALAFYNWAIVNVGTVDIWSGVLAMLAYGVASVGALERSDFSSLLPSSRRAPN